MGRVAAVLAFLSFFPLAFFPCDVAGTSPCSNSLSPPFISSGVKPNILIILDNSNSFDEDFYGNAVGSYSPASKSVVARQSLQQIVTELQGKADVGVMTFTLPGDVSSMYVHNALPFASYNPASYCPNPPPDCVEYCTTGNAVSQGNCQASCQQQNPNFSTNFTDIILSPPPVGPYAFNEPTGTRARYCGLAYPKNQKWQDATHPSNSTIYFNQADPFYDWSNDGILYGYSGSPPGSQYSAAENASNEYTYCTGKTGTSDSWSGYGGSCTNYWFVPTDSDWALGFYNWGQQMPWYYVGPTWFSSTSVSGIPQGYLNVAVGDLTGATQFNNVYNIFAPNEDTSQNVGNNTPYMSCHASNKNTCSYIINAGNTPTAGTLLSAFNYYSGTFTQNGTKSASPITSSCQKNYVIFVTDGLPDTMLNGSMPITTTQYCYNSAGQTNNQTCSAVSSCPSPYNASCSTVVMGQVLGELYSLQSSVSQKIGSTSYTFPVKTYFLGVGLTTQAQTQLDQMAVAGGTAQTSGHAYYANDATQLYDALESIITDLLGRVAAGSSVSILSQGQTQNGDNMLQGVFYPTKYFGSTPVSWPGFLYNWWFYNGTSNNGVSYNNIREDTVHDFILELDEDYGLTFAFDQQNGLSINRYSDPTGSGDPNVFVNNVGLDSLTPIWEAGKLLFQQSAASRLIYTPGTNSSGSGLVSFDTSNSSLTSSPSLLGSPSNFDPCLNGSLQNLINYVRGTDIKYCSNGSSFNYQSCNQNSDCTTGQFTTCVNACRNRTAGLCYNGTSFSSTPCTTNSDCSSTSYPTCTQNVWKLGDIVYSTPKVQIGYQYCSNGTTFGAKCTQNSDCPSGYTCQAKESVVFVGANDGMLHAIKTGVLTTNGMDPTKHQVETFMGIPDASMGTELWAFIPQNSLPYLRCLAVPPPSSCHLYYNDLSPYMATMVSNGVPKTILIGGMRLGGGSIQASSPANYCFSSAGLSNGQTCAQHSNCTTAPYNSSCSPAYPTNVPPDTCPGGVVTCANNATCYNPSNCTGLSSYYALDVTDPENPVLLWEFSHPFLGYTYSGPAVIHKFSDPVHLTGDQYFVMFLSGPTGASDGSSIQDVQAFVLTLNSSLGISSIYYNDLGQKNGFGGRLFTNGLSVNGDPYTDFVFFGYSSAPNGATGSWQGGIGVVNTNYTDPTDALNPQNWNWDLTTYSNIAQLPVTAQIGTGQCFNQTYLFAGTGRYFFPQDNYGSTANSGLNSIMGIPFARYCSNGTSSNYQVCTQNSDCTTGLFTSCRTATPTVNSLTQTTTACSALQNSNQNIAGAAWRYNLDAASADGTYLTERMITDPSAPVVSNNTSNDIAYFVSSEPTMDPCGYGGQTRVWGINCATGGAINDQSCNGFTVTNTAGTLYLQTSTGAVYKIDNSSSFTAAGGRATQFFPGMPPETQPPVVQPATTNTAKGGQLIQWIEK
jgi:type IV pilus assembly protein PilY1